MSTLPSFLSSLTKIGDDVGSMYSVFKTDFVHSSLYFNGKRVQIDRRKTVAKIDFNSRDINVLIDGNIVKNIKTKKDYLEWTVNNKEDLEDKLRNISPISDKKTIIKIWEFNNKEETFWHLVQKFEHMVKDRVIDRDRALRLSWVRPIIENSDNAAITKWDYLEGTGKIRTYLWLKEHDFLVILEPKRTIAILITAFYVNKKNEGYFEKKYQKRINNGV